MYMMSSDELCCEDSCKRSTKNYAVEAKLMRLPVKVWQWRSVPLDDKDMVVRLPRSSE